jgi:NRPS condensation-like uncharacterized protein
MSPSLTKSAKPAAPRFDGHAARWLATTRRIRRLFPLPLAPFERLFLSDESPSYPMQFFYRLRFLGQLQRYTLDKALHTALARHPLLTAVVQENRNPHWAACSDPMPAVEWLAQEPAPPFPPARPIDIRKRPGLQVVAVVGSNRSDLILQFHHAACDGVGAFDFATDLLTAYANAAAGTSRYRFKPLDIERLGSRGAWALDGWQLFRWSMRQTESWRSLWRFFRRRPAALLPHRAFLDDAAPPPTFPEACVHHFDRDESAALARLAHGSETTLNGLLVRDLFLALGQWRRRHNLPADDWLRLMIPINMRTAADRRLPAANKVSMFFLDHCSSEEPDAAALLARINGVLANIKDDHFGLAWPLGLRVLDNVLSRQWAHARLSRRRCLYSTLLTNLGPVLAASPLPRDDRRLVVGDMILDEVEFVPITRPLQCLGFAVSTYAGKMTVGMRYDSRVVMPEQAREVLDIYLAALRGSCNKQS